MNHKKERNMDYRERLEKLKKYELQALAAKSETVTGKNATKLRLNSKHEARNRAETKQIQNSNVQNSKQKEPGTLVLSF
jgi:hypothetical protein